MPRTKLNPNQVLKLEIRITPQIRKRLLIGNVLKVISRSF